MQAAEQITYNGTSRLNHYLDQLEGLKKRFVSAPSIEVTKVDRLESESCKKGFLKKIFKK